MRRHIQWHQLGTPWGHAPPPLFNKNPNISETSHVPTPKPYIFFFLMLRHIQWHGKGFPHGAWHSLFTLFKALFSETIQIPTPKLNIFLFHMLRCIQWHQPGSPGAMPQSLHFIKGLWTPVGDFVLLCNTTASCYWLFCSVPYCSSLFCQCYHFFFLLCI